jgi:hypothetical protein
MLKNGQYIDTNICFISGGGQSSNQSSSQQATSGFQALSPQIQNVFNQLATTAGGYIPGTASGGSTSNMFTPLPQTAGETTALNTINQGFNPSASQLQSSINEQMNPYNQDVIDQINKNAYGQNSMLSSQLTQAGQFGSNRAVLGANDIANTQASTIGSILNPEYNNAVTNALTTIPQLNAQSASAQLQGGQFQRQLAGQTAQAPVSSLASIAQILGILPTQSGQSTGSSNGSSSGFNFGLFSSDINLKENIVPAGTENGFNLYEFNYKGGNKRFIGVMAHEVEAVKPEAIIVKDGQKKVNYAMIGVRFRGAA